MIHLCTCTGGSASTVSASKGRGETVSCKNCGGNPTIDGKRSSSSCLLSTVLELTSLINSDVTWTKVSKGCRSSSRRPRTSSTVTLAGGELLTKDSKGLEMPISESEKLGVSVLGCHFSEKAEHIPIKKRRFLFRASSPPGPPHGVPNPSSEGTERDPLSLKASIHGLQLNPNTTCVSAPSDAVSGLCHGFGNNDKPDEKELVKPGEDDDFSGISILAAAACSNSLGVEADQCEGSGIISSATKSPEAPITVEFKGVALSMKDDSSSPDESTLDNSSSQIPVESAASKMNQEASMIQKSPTRDVRLNWDLNTVMDVWEEPFVLEHENSAHDNVKSVEEKKIDYELGMERESGKISENVTNLMLPIDPKSLAHENEVSKLGKRDAIPVSRKWAKVDTELTMDCSVPPGFDHCMNTHASKENVGVTSNGVAMEDSVSKGTDLPREDALLVKHSSVIVEINDEPAVRSDNSLSDNRAGSGIDKLEELSVGYDSQYEDGELRESSMHGENEYGTETRGADSDVGIAEARDTTFQCEQENSSTIKLTDVVREADVLSSIVLPEKLRSSEEVSGSGPNETIVDQGKRDVAKHANQPDEWKMNVSGWDLLPENHRNSSNSFTKTTRNFSGRKFSYREQKDGFETEDAETKGEGSRFYRKESLTRVGGPSTRDTFLSSRGRFRMQGCSSKAADDLPSRPERELGPLRSFGRGRYSPPTRASGRGGGTWNRSPERIKRLPSPSYQGPSFLRSMLDDVGSVDNISNEADMDPSNVSRPNNSSSYVTRRAFRSRSPMNREENDFRARLGLRPTGDSSHDRFVNVGRGRGRGRTMRYGSRINGDGPRSRFHGPTSDECDELLTEYSHPFPRRRRCFSPIERRGNLNQNHSYSRSPSRPRTRSPVGGFGFRRRSSRSPNFSRIRRPRSPNYRRFEADHASEYNSGPRNNTSPPPRWVNYKERSNVFDRRSPPPPPPGERFGFYDSSRKPKQNEYYRSGHPGRFSDVNESGRGRPRYTDGYRRGGFVRRYMDEPTKRFHYEEEEGFGLGYDSRDKHALEFHAQGNPKPYGNGTTDSRFRDFLRRPRDDFKRRFRDVKDEVSEHATDDSQRRPREAKDESTNINSKANDEVKEADKPILGSN